jgi:hypothetical protein
MELSKDEAKILIAMILDDLDAIRDFTLLLDTFECEALPSRMIINLSQNFITTLTLGKAAIARMLIEIDEAPVPNQLGMEVLEFWEEIEDKVLERETNNE